MNLVNLRNKKIVKKAKGGKENAWQEIKKWEDSKMHKDIREWCMAEIERHRTTYSVIDILSWRLGEGPVFSRGAA